MSQLKVACVGAGYFSQFHYDAWSRLEQCEIIALCDMDADKAQATAKKFDISQVYTDPGQLFENADFDIVDIITPPATHPQMVELAAKRGRHIVCQKPFGEDLDAATRMVAMTSEADVTMVIHENFRFMPWYRVIKTKLNEGVLGDILDVQFNLRPGDGQGEDAYMARQPYFQKMEKFLIHETAIHMIDTFRFLFGEPVNVYADLRRCNSHISGEDAGTLVFGYLGPLQLRFNGNRLLDHAASNTRRTMGEMLIEGTQGTLRLDGEARLWLRQFGETQETPLAYDWLDQHFGGDCVYNCIKHIANHFLNQSPIENTAEAYLRNIEIENAVYRSNEINKRIDI